jgi:hypothetical protein
LHQKEGVNEIREGQKMLLQRMAALLVRVDMQELRKFFVVEGMGVAFSVLYSILH